MLGTSHIGEHQYQHLPVHLPLHVHLHDYHHHHRLTALVVDVFGGKGHQQKQQLHNLLFLYDVVKQYVDVSRLAQLTPHQHELLHLLLHDDCLQY